MNRLFLVFLCVLSLSGWIAALAKKPQLAFIDIPQALSKPAHMLSKTTMEKTKQKQILKTYASILSGVIQEYAKENGLTVISGNLLSNYGGRDITDLMITKTLQRVRQDAE